jgi:hypothetical protein
LALLTALRKVDLPALGSPDQADIGEQLEAKPHPHFLARPAGAVLARRAVGGGLVAGVAAAAVAALQQHHALADLRQVGEDMLLVVGDHLGAHRHLNDKVLAARAGAV